MCDVNGDKESTFSISQAPCSRCFFYWDSGWEPCVTLETHLDQSANVNLNINNMFIIVA